MMRPVMIKTRNLTGDNLSIKMRPVMIKTRNLTGDKLRISIIYQFKNLRTNTKIFFKLFKK